MFSPLSREAPAIHAMPSQMKSYATAYGTAGCPRNALASRLLSSKPSPLRAGSDPITAERPCADAARLRSGRACVCTQYSVLRRWFQLSTRRRHHDETHPGLAGPGQVRYGIK